MKIVNKKIEELKPYKNNPRHNDNAVEQVANSIKEFGFKVPIIIDKNNEIIAGHTRLKASIKLGLEEVPCIVADDLNEEQIKAFRLADNKVSELAQWDYGLLDLELDSIFDIDMTSFGFDLFEEEPIYKYNDAEEGSLVERFIVPPFSVLDTRQGYWQDRKRQWMSIGIESEKGRDTNLIKGDLEKSAKAIGMSSTGTSIFDPVLTEIMYKWFNVSGGSVLDPFAGGSVRGVVAKMTGYNYTGIDLSDKQIKENKEQAKKIGVEPTWICDDSLNTDKHIDEKSIDMVFSCPPYHDLEVYSDDERDLSNMDYEDFMVKYSQIIKKSCDSLKDNRFAVFVVGDIRDKRGFYRDFISYTKKAFKEAGLHLYNEFILLEAIGSAALRAPKYFCSNRKVVKVHQNILVFYKGDESKIKENYNFIDIQNIEDWLDNEDTEN